MCRCFYFLLLYSVVYSFICLFTCDVSESWERSWGFLRLSWVGWNWRKHVSLWKNWPYLIRQEWIERFCPLTWGLFKDTVGAKNLHWYYSFLGFLCRSQSSLDCLLFISISVQTVVGRKHKTKQNGVLHFWCLASWLHHFVKISLGNCFPWNNWAFQQNCWISKPEIVKSKWSYWLQSIKSVTV